MQVTILGEGTLFEKRIPSPRILAAPIFAPHLFKNFSKNREKV